MLGRLIFGIVKGLIVGGLIGFGLFKLGIAVFPMWLALVAAAVTGVVIGLVAGKPIWAKDARIEAGVKAAVGALLGAGLMFGVQKFLQMPLPPPLLGLLGLKDQAPTLAQLPMTSLAVVAALLGGFYDADNTPEPEGAKTEANAPAEAKPGPNKRIATPPSDEDLDEDLDEAADEKKAKK
jgi:hypothetical protein